MAALAGVMAEGLLAKRRTSLENVSSDPKIAPAPPKDDSTTSTIALSPLSQPPISISTKALASTSLPHPILPTKPKKATYAEESEPATPTSPETQAIDMSSKVNASDESSVLETSTVERRVMAGAIRLPALNIGAEVDRDRNYLVNVATSKDNIVLATSSEVDLSEKSAEKHGEKSTDKKIPISGIKSPQLPTNLTSSTEKKTLKEHEAASLTKQPKKKTLAIPSRGESLDVGIIDPTDAKVQPNSPSSLAAATASSTVSSAALNQQNHASTVTRGLDPAAPPTSISPGSATATASPSPLVSATVAKAPPAKSASTPAPTTAASKVGKHDVIDRTPSLPSVNKTSTSNASPVKPLSTRATKTNSTSSIPEDKVRFRPYPTSLILHWSKS